VSSTLGTNLGYLVTHNDVECQPVWIYRLQQHVLWNVFFVIKQLDDGRTLPKSTIAALQQTQNAAARMVTGIGLGDHVTPAVKQLH